jgi:hypothetical protein
MGMTNLTENAVKAIIINCVGEVAEWLKATDCKSVLSEYNGSNPFFPTTHPLIEV